MGANTYHIFYRHSVMFRHHDCVLRTTAGQEDPFELDSNLLLSSGRHGEDRKRQCSYLYDHETPLLDDLADLLYQHCLLTVLVKLTLSSRFAALFECARSMLPRCNPSSTH